jgi:hydrogenase nickel incorporation protein HypB
MCATCGCGQDEVRLSGHERGHEHGHGDGREHGLGEERGRTVAIEQAVLARNDHLARRNRAWLRENRIRAVNLMSSPGAGKTSLLERTIREYPGEVCVIEGDQETQLDADRIRNAGARAVQVNTGAGCHLDATMVSRALERLGPTPGSLVFVENVGNLVCPAMFDLGENRKVVVISVTEGDDKPLKYPHMFAAADLVVVNKTDLLPYVDFDLDRCETDARKLNRDLEVIAVSVKSGENLDTWYAWLDAATPAWSSP